MNNYFVAFLRAAATAGLVFGMTYMADPADAAVPPSPVIIEPAPTGVIELHQRPDGTYSWQVNLNAHGPFIASWERSSGLWTSVEEAKEGLQKHADCQKSVRNAWLEQWTSFDDVKAHDESPLPNRWESSSINGALIECGTSSGWSPEQVTTSSADTGVNVDIPIDLIGPGTHQLFVIGLAMPDNDTLGQAGCAHKLYADGSWAGAGCSYEMSEPVQFTVTVPFPPVKGTVLPGAVAAEGAAFHPTVFSRLAAAPLVEDTGIDSDTLTKAGLTVALAVVLAVLIALPTELLESTISNNNARINRITRRFRPVAERRRHGTASSPSESAEGSEACQRPPRTRRLVHGVSRWWAVPVLVLGSIIGGFADPQFGVNWLSLRLLITLFLGFVVVNLGGTFLAWLLTRRRTGAERPRLKARPVYLLLILVTVVFARTINIEPSLVFGTLLAIDYGNRLTQARSGAVTIIGAAYSTILGLAAWWAYTVIAGFRLADVGNLSEIDKQYTFTVYAALTAAQTGIGEFASVVCVQALSIVPIALLPMAFLSGAALWKWKKLAWVITYAAGLAAYSAVLVPLPMSWKEISQPLALWVAMFVAYALIAVGIWSYFRFTPSRPAETSDHDDSRSPVDPTGTGSPTVTSSSATSVAPSGSPLHTDEGDSALQAQRMVLAEGAAPAPVEVAQPITSPISHREETRGQGNEEHAVASEIPPEAENAPLFIQATAHTSGEPNTDGHPIPAQAEVTAPR